MLIELSENEIFFSQISINSNSIAKLTPDDYIFKYDNEKYNKVSKEIIYDDFLDKSFLFNHNLRNFSIKHPKQSITAFYTKTTEFGNWRITLYNNTTNEETRLDYENPEHAELIEQYKIDDTAISIFENFLGDVPFIKKNEDINFTTIKKNLFSDLQGMYNDDFEEIIILQYALKNELDFIIVEEFNPNLIENGFKLENFHKHVFNNINIFNEYKNVETAIQELFLKKTLGVELSSLKKYNSLFSGKLPMPGLYLYKYMVNYMKLLNKKSIPARVLKKRGRKPKKKPEDEAQTNTEQSPEKDTGDDKQ